MTYVRNRRSTALASTGLLVLTMLGTLVLSEQSAHAATATLYVDWDAPDPGPACTLANPCESISEAIALSYGAFNDDNAVVISIGAGDQFVNSVDLDGDPDTVDPASVSFVGAGAGSTFIRPLAGYQGRLFSTQVTYPVSFSGLTLTGARGADGAAGIGGHAAPVSGIESYGSGALSVTDVVITDIQGGAGGTGNNPIPSADGGFGGRAMGILAKGDLTVTRTVISNLRGGAGAAATSPSTDATSFGGRGGDVWAISAEGPGTNAQVISSTLADLRGGAGGAAAEGTGAGGVDKGVGGAGGDAVGVNDYNGNVTLTRSTINLLRGGNSGPSAFGSGYEGGFALGLTSEGGGNTDLLASTITDLVSGNGGNGTTFGGRSGYAAGIDWYDNADPGAVSVVSSTISAITLGTSGSGATPGLPGNNVGIGQNGSTLTLTASLIAVPGAFACESTSSVLGLGNNVVSDSTCGAGTNQVVPGIANTLGPLGNNGGTTRTIPLLANSPALNAVPAPSAVCAVPDQRGTARPNGAGQSCDAGAFEYIPPVIAPPAPPAPPAAKPKCDGRTATKVGTNGNDIIRGTSGRDVIVALGGNDTIRGLGGNDLICGGDGRDKLLGGKGSDKLLGGSGNDRLEGNAGKDNLAGNGGRDVLIGGPGKDKLAGGPGKDVQRT